MQHSWNTTEYNGKIDLSFYMKRILSFIGIDRAVLYTLVGRGWSLGAGLLTVILVVRYLTIQEQGYYYTFSSLVAMQVMFELGMSYVVMQFASHEMAHLTWSPSGTIEGDSNSISRLRSLVLLVTKWYAAISVCIVVIILPVGWVVLSSRSNLEKVFWQPAWVWLVITAAINIFLMPTLSLLEGCGRIVEIARLRMHQNMLGSLLAWLTLIAGGGVFALPAMNTGFALITITWLWRTKKLFLKKLLVQTTSVAVIKWKEEIWPFQWKIAVSWLSSYFLFQLFVPVLFYYRGAVEAGQMGMSMTIANALATIAMSWMNTKAPTFGALVAKRDYKSLDRLFALALMPSLIVMIFLGAILCALNYYFHLVSFSFSNRVLNPIAFSMLILTGVFNFIAYAQSTYLRAHKEDPFMLLSVIGALITATTTLYFAEKYGATGVVAANLFGAVFFGFGCCSTIFYVKRRKWQNAATQSTNDA